VRGIGWRGALGIALSAALLVWALWGIDFGEVARSLARANLALLVLSALVATTTFPLRARRWQVILSPVLADPPFGPLWRSTAVGVMVNNVVPARAGELARAFAVSRELPPIPFSAALASLAVDRVFDAVVILALMLLAALDPAFPANESIGRWAGFGVVLVVALLAALYLVVFFPRRLVAIFGSLTRRVAPRLEERVRAMLLAFASGLGVLRHPGRFLSVLAWTLLHWLVNALAFWLAFVAVGIEVPASAALFLQGVIGFGVAVPSAPGFFGTFELSAILGLRLYGVPREAAVSWAIGFHLLSFVPITAIGAWYFARLGMHFRDLGAAQSEAGADGATVGEPSIPESASPAGRRS
jgi:glycosyltransferase 2 family protein